MLKNYFKIAWRNILRSKGHAFINIGGLGVGMAAAILILLWVQFEFSVDRFHKHSNRVYAVWRNINNQGVISSMDYLPSPYVPTMREQFPEVEKATRLTPWNPQLLSVGENAFYEQTTFVDPGFFEVFSFEAVEGDPVESLKEPNSIVLTETTARKLFGEENAMGKTVTVDQQMDFEVKAIIKDLPENTQFKKYTAFLPFLKLEQLGWAGDFWGNNSLKAFVLIKEGTDIRRFNEKFADFTARNSDEKSISDFLFPMADIHLKSRFENGVSVGGRIDLIRLFGMVAIIVLLIACINFVNLSTAQNENRAKEVGVRKVIGANRGMLIGQFLVESVLLALLSFIVASLLISLTFPWFRELIGKNIQSPFYQPFFWALSAAFVLVTGVLAGSYPAFLLSSFRPAEVFKSKLLATKYWIDPRKALVMFQFAIVAVLISSAWIIRNQIIFVQNRDLGFNKDNLVFGLVSESIKKNSLALRNELLQMNEVVSVSYTFSPLTAIKSSTDAMNWQGKEEGYRLLVSRMGADAGLVKTGGLELLAGRDIDIYTYPGDSLSAVLNETAVEKMGFGDPIGQVIKDDDLSFTVVGVVKDFIMDSPFEKADAIMVQGPKRKSWLDYIHIRLKENINLSQAIAKLENVFGKFNPGVPFDYKFVDQAHEQKFDAQKRTGSLIGVFTALAILISCMGLFGLASFVTKRRTKEISVRKVLGASVPGLVRLISSDFTKLVLIAVALAVPLSWYFMEEWLGSFSYRIAIDWKVFLGTALAVLMIAFLTVGYQAIKAALTNPAKTLKSE